VSVTGRPQAVAVEVTKSEVMHAVWVGGARHAVAISQGRHNDIVQVDADWQCDIEGAIGELVVAKALGRFWTPNIGGNDKADGDVAGYHVRACRRRDGSLIIRDADPDEAVFVLVTGEPFRLYIPGWLHAGSGKRPQYRRAPNGGPPAYFVPAGDLQPWDGRPF
jgi:hypothetical protein